MYIVPPEIWRERYNNFLNQNVTETISAGIIRSVSKGNVKGHSQYTRSQDVIVKCQRSFTVTQDNDMICSSSLLVYLWGGTDLKIKI